MAETLPDTQGPPFVMLSNAKHLALTVLRDLFGEILHFVQDDAVRVLMCIWGLSCYLDAYGV